MIRLKQLTALIPALTLSTLAIGAIGPATEAVADDAPPPSSAPPADEPSGRHHNPAWAGCKKQADDQKLAPGDARKEFMKNCVKSAKSTAPAAS
jgi:psiF repeat